MAIVCKDRDGASQMRNFCDRLHGDLSAGKKITPPSAEEFAALNSVIIIGVLTLEDVIEKILRIDIHDEKDREKAVLALQMKTVNAIQNENFGEVSMGQLAPYMTQKYRVGSDASPLRATTSFEDAPNPDGIYSSKFVMSFVKGLDKMVREEIKTQTSPNKSKSLEKKYQGID